MPSCPTCFRKEGVEIQSLANFKFLVECQACGEFETSRPAIDDFGSLLHDPLRRAILSHVLRKMQSRGSRPFLTFDVADRIVSGAKLPAVREQANNLVLWLGNELLYSNPAGRHKVLKIALTAIIGALDVWGADYVIDELERRKILLFTSAGYKYEFGLTFDGWEAYDSLQREHTEGSIAFMAMPFGEDTLERVFRECFKPSVSATGFDLRRLDENAPAGLIDNRLRVEIRKSRFLIADLTFGNHGAYWEAGFAEGLGKPVIYTCEKSYFETEKTHFDTSHHHTIRWDETDLESAAEDLKTTIRATLPDEAVLADDAA